MSKAPKLVRTVIYQQQEQNLIHDYFQPPRPQRGKDELYDPLCTAPVEQQLTFLTGWQPRCHFCICATRLTQKAGGIFCLSPDPYSR